VSRFEAIPQAISPKVLTEQGTTIMPLVLKEPLATAAPMSSMGYQASARSFRERLPEGNS